jgi:dienelactone hydrolase
MAERRSFDPKRVLAATTGLLDRAVVMAMQARGRHESARVDAMTHDERLAVLAEIHSAYEGEALVTDTDRFFPPSSTAVELTRKPVRTGVWDVSWSSDFTPFLPTVAERYLSRVENRTARARLFLGSDARSSRPAVIAIHGYMGGQWVVEENVWPIEWLSRRGLDVALPLLPFHGVRAGSHRGAPGFPSSDPRMTIEGFRQAVADLRTLARWFRERGAKHVGVMGMSLGGYTAALLATVTSELDFVMPMIPLASIADFAREQRRLGTGPQEEAEHAALERAHRVVSPLARPLKVDKARALVVAAEHDRITPIAHATRLARHFDCTMLTMAGAHLVQLGRSDAFRALASLLEREAIIAPRPKRA